MYSMLGLAAAAAAVGASGSTSLSAQNLLTSRRDPIAIPPQPLSPPIMRPNASLSLAGAFRGLSIAAPATTRPVLGPCFSITARSPPACAAPPNVRQFSATATRPGTWLEPSIKRTKKMMKGRVRVATGGSTKGTQVAWGDYGLRMTDHHRRISAQHLKIAEDTIKARLRGQKYRLYKRKNCNLGVFVSGNEV